MSKDSDQIDRSLSSLSLGDAFLLLVCWLAGLNCLIDFGIDWALDGSPRWALLVAGVLLAATPFTVIVRLVSKEDS